MISPTSIPDETLTALAEVIRSPLPFQICGSRFFGDAKSTSDYDFIIERKCDEQLGAKLVKAGWKDKWAEKSNPYQDRNTAALFEKGEVQIIVVYNLAIRLAAREHIKKNNLNRHSTDTWEDFYTSKP